MPFAKFLVYVERMQSQLRAENGIKEVVLGYYGDDREVGPDSLDEIDFDALNEGWAGSVQEVTHDQLPPEIRDILEAEMHRLRTGEIVSIAAWRQRKIHAKAEQHVHTAAEEFAYGEVST